MTALTYHVDNIIVQIIIFQEEAITSTDHYHYKITTKKKKITNAGLATASMPRPISGYYSPVTVHACLVSIAVKSLRKHAYLNILKILPPKNENFQIKNYIVFHISAQNIDCGYSLEPPWWGSSNEYSQSMFLSRYKKNNVYPWKPQFYYIKGGFMVFRVVSALGCFSLGRFGPGSFRTILVGRFGLIFYVPLGYGE